MANDFTLVTCCDDCPFFNDKIRAYTHCSHPKAFNKSISVGNGTLPEKCPLRDGPWTVRISANA
jgi:hypothetical protein